MDETLWTWTDRPEIGEVMFRRCDWCVYHHEVGSLEAALCEIQRQTALRIKAEAERDAAVLERDTFRFWVQEALKDIERWGMSGGLTRDLRNALLGSGTEDTFKKYRVVVEQLSVERDAVTTRAEEAERERDEACIKHANERVFANEQLVLAYDAEKRAEKAERERDEARALIGRVLQDASDLTDAEATDAMNRWGGGSGMNEDDLKKIEHTYLREPFMGGVPALQQHVIRRLVDELRRVLGALTLIEKAERERDEALARVRELVSQGSRGGRDAVETWFDLTRELNENLS